jgi:hypothetical protein
MTRMTRFPRLLSASVVSVPLALACGPIGPGSPGPDGGGGSNPGSSGGSGSAFGDSGGGAGDGGAVDSADPDSTARAADASPVGFMDAASGRDGGGVDAAAPPPVPPPACKTDITSQVLANASIALAGDSCVLLPAGTTQYGGVISGAGTVTLKAPNGAGTLVVTGDSTFTLPASQQGQTTTKTANYYTIQNPDPPVVYIESNATLQLGSATSTTGSIASTMPNTGTEVINRDNMQVNGTLAMGGGPSEHFGILSGTGTIIQPIYAGGTFWLVGDNPFAGTLSILTGGYVGSLGVESSFPFAKVIFNNGSMIMNSPPTLGFTLSLSVYEDHYGDDINTDHGIITFAGIYSYSNSGDRMNPSLSDPSLNTTIVTNGPASPRRASGRDSSFRGINLEGGTTRWGDGTTSTFFLPSAPSPADPTATKNSYINLHRGSTLIFDYNGKYVCNIGITGGGGGPNASGSVGVGNLTIAATAGNYAVLTMPQNYNGTTTIGAGATLQLGSGAPVQAMGATVGAATAAEPQGAITSTTVLAIYSGDSSLLTAQSPNGAAGDSIVDNGTLVVDNTATAISLSNISGPGAFVQLGAATTTLLSNAYSGGTTISGGSLIVGSDTSLGTGSVACSGGGLSVASGQHAIHVGGDYSQGASGTLTLDLGGTVQGTDYNYVAIAGNAALGGTLVLNAVAGFAPAVGTRFIVVQAAGGVGGAFSAVTSTTIKLVASYDATHCYVTVTP